MVKVVTVGEMELFAECLPKEYKGKRSAGQFGLPLHADKDPVAGNPDSINSIRAETHRK